MEEKDDRTYVQRWLASTIGLWCRLAPVAVLFCIGVKLTGIECTASVPWGAVVVAPALAVIPGISLFCGWLTFMTHRWDIENWKNENEAH